MGSLIFGIFGVIFLNNLFDVLQFLYFWFGTYVLKAGECEPEVIPDKPFISLFLARLQNLLQLRSEYITLDSFSQFLPSEELLRGVELVIELVFLFMVFTLNAIVCKLYLTLEEWIRTFTLQFY